MTRTVTFDSAAPWGTVTHGTGYDVEMHPGDGGWNPTLVITPKGSPASYHFVQSWDDKGAFTPGYVIAAPALTDRVLDTGVYSLPDELPVPKWMPEAVERAGFRYDPVPNNERRSVTEPYTHPDQTELTEV